MAKTTVKPRSGEKDSLLAISKKSKSLEKKTSKKNSTIKSPEAKKVSLAVKKERKNVQKKKEAADINTEAIDASPEKEIKLKSKVLLKPKSKAPENKSNRFDEIKKIHKVLQGKKLMKLKREQEDKDSDESADEDDEACKSYAQDFGMDDDENSIDGSEDEQSQENNVEPKKTKDAKLEKTKDAKPKKTKDAKPKKTKDAKPEKGTDANPEEGMDVDPEESTEAKPKMKREFVDANDPEEQARTVLIKNVSMKTSRRQITHLMSPYGKVVSVRLRNLPVLNRIKASAVKTQVKLKQFKKEATSCCAYVKFVLPEQATAALAANGSEMDGHHLFVVPVMSKSGEEKRRMLSAGCQVVVGNLPYSMEPEPLYREFISCGDIVDVSVPKNKHGSCMGVAFIEFKDKVSVKAALAKAGATLQGREIRVTKAVKKVKKPRSGVANTQTMNNSNNKINKNNESPKEQAAKKRDTPLAAKKRFNKDEMKKRNIARKLAAKK